MMNSVNTRELVLGILLQVNKEGEYSHIAIRNTLEKYQYLSKQDRSFITRVCEGTLEYRLKIDYIINQFSNVKVNKMKPVIREILRSGVYQLLYMDSIPDSAVCNEAVKLAQKKGFYSLKGFVNGVLRTIARQNGRFGLPKKEQHVEYLSVVYSMPVWLVVRWLDQLGFEAAEGMLKAFLEERPTTVRCQEYLNSVDDTVASLKSQGVKVEKAPYVKSAYYISDYDYLPALLAFNMGRIQVQDVSSMLVGEIAAPRPGDYIIDMCAAPGGKSLHVADKMKGRGRVEARDISQYKVEMMEDNFRRAEAVNIEAVCKDATAYEEESAGKADIVLADVPCSGLGVIGRKTDIKYKMTPEKQEQIIKLQRKILENAAAYVKPGGTLIYSTCTVAREENQDNLHWFVNNYPFETESLDPYLCDELHSETTGQGYLQLLPGKHKSDGFFIARLRRVK